MTKANPPEGFIRCYSNKPLKHGYEHWIHPKQEKEATQTRNGPIWDILTDGVRIELSQEEKDIIKQALGKFDTGSKLAAFLRRKCNCQNPEDMTWQDILGALSEYSEDKNSSNAQEKGEATSMLPPSQEKAYQSYELAAKKLREFNEREPKDAECYNWLKENGFDQDENYVLPAKHTWITYVRKARKHHGTLKNQKRAGREARSVVRHNQV